MSRFGVLLLTLLWAVLAHAEPLLQASVDRTRLNEGETVVLTLESTDPTRFGRPDLSPLDEHFEILGSRQVNRLSNQVLVHTYETEWGRVAH